MTITIREGIRDDLPLVFDLVKELALFEKEPEAVTTNIGAYYEAFDKKQIGLLIAEVDGIGVGIMLYYNAFSTWKGPMIYLEDFVVREEWRGHGIGDRLFESLIQLAKEQGKSMLKWQVLDWNEGAIRFYKRIGAEIEEGWYNGKLFLP